MKTFLPTRFLFALSLAAGLAALPANASQVSVYLSAPGAQSSTVTFSTGTGLTTETFDSKNGSYSAYSSAIGTYSGSFVVQNADAYGGAGGTSYAMVAPGPVSIALARPANYFGIWMSAGDANNGISLYSAGTDLLRVGVSDILAILAAHPPVAMNGTAYNAQSYYCNPNNNLDCGEPFVYVSFVSQGTTFDKVVLDNSGQTGTAFESDNHSVANGTAVIPGSFVNVETLPTATPEPGTILLTLAGLATLGTLRARRRRAR